MKEMLLLNFKRIIAYALALTIISGSTLCIETADFIKNDIAVSAVNTGYGGSCGENCKWSFDSETGALTITGSGAMKDYSYDSQPWLSYAADIKSVTIENGITSIGNNAFYNCSSLEYADISDSVTSVGSASFSACKSLKDITIPQGMTDINQFAFSGCSSFSELTIPDSVTSIADHAFGNCTGLYKVTIPDSITTIEQGVFMNCTSLSEVHLPDSIKTIRYQSFWGCTSLTGITLPPETETIESFAFKECSGLVKVVFPESVTSIGGRSFESCPLLKNIYVLNPQAEISENAFGYMYSVSTPIDGVTIHGYADSTAQTYAEENSLAFETVAENQCGENCTYSFDSETGTLTISGSGAMKDYSDFSTASWFDYEQDIKSVVIEDGITSIGNFAFYQCSNLKSVSIPDSVTSIGDSAFYYCKNLLSIQIPDSVTSIGSWALGGCSSLTSVIVPDGITSIEYSAFRNCSSLLAIAIPESVVSFGDDAFENCTALADIYYSGTETKWNTIKTGSYNEDLNNAAVHYDYSKDSNYIGSCGDDCTYSFSSATGTLTVSGTGDMTEYKSSYEIPWEDYTSDIKSVVIKKGVTSVGNYAFDNCSNLTSVTVADSVISIKPSAFSYCGNLTSITIPEGVKSIGDWALGGCSSLTSVTIPDSVAYIGHNAFAYCSSLTSINIPASVASIGNEFYSCSSLTDITVDSRNNYYSSVDGVLFNKDKSLLIAYPSGKKDEIYTIPDGVTSIGKSAFTVCNNLSIVNIPDSVSSIEDSAFDLCINLKSITIPDGVTSVGERTFHFCKNMTSVTIPDSITSIGYQAFDECKSLTDVYYKGTETQWNSIETGLNNDPLTSATIYYNYSEPETTTTETTVTTAETTVTTTSAKTTTTTEPPVTTTSAKTTTTTEPPVTTTSAKTTTTTEPPVTTTTTTTTTTTSTTETSSSETSNRKFEYEKDTWVFPNREDYFGTGEYYVSKTSLYKLYSQVSNVEKNSIKRHKRSGWSGSCYGMAVTSILANAGIFNISDWQTGSEYLREIEPISKDTNDDTESLINYYFLTQFTTEIQQAVAENAYKDDSVILSELVQSLENGGNPALVCFSGKLYDKLNGGHAVTAYGVEKGSWVKDGLLCTKRILIYDNNYSEFSDNACIYLNDDCTKWCIPIYKTGSVYHENDHINLASSDISLINNKGFINGTNYSSDSGFISKMTSESDNFNFSISKIKEVDGSFSFNGAVDTDEIKIIYPMYADSENKEFSMLLRDSTSGYQYTADNAEAMNISMEYLDSMYEVNLSNGKSVRFTPDGYVDIEADISSFEIKSTFNEDMCNLPWYTVGVSGKYADSVKFEQTEQGFVMSGDNLVNIIVRANSDDINTSAVFSTSAEKVLIYSIDEKTIGVSADTDGNGSFETELETGSMGDIDGDGNITSADALKILQSVTNLSQLDDMQSCLADIDGDGMVTSADALRLLQYTVGLYDEL